MSGITFTPQPTPNPRTYKFVADREIRPGTSRAYYSPAGAAEDPAAARLFALPGVTAVLMVSNFCSITQDGSQNWETLAPQIQALLAQLFQ